MLARLRLLRSWAPSPAAVRRTFLGALVMNTVIVATGGAVRLTASGLGCPTVPKCTDTSMVVTREMGVHGAIEFGNRMLTFVLTAAVVAALVTAWRASRRDLVRVAGVLFLGIVAQAVLGAVTVLTGLNPVTVMAHFLVSMGLLAVATYGFDVARGARVPATVVVRPEIRLGGYLLTAVVAATLVAGTVVTGTGPHSGDKHASHRLPFDLASVTQLHADLVVLLLGLTTGLIIALRATDAPAAVVRRGTTLLVVALAQGLIGFTQYVTDLPVLLVGLHVLGAALVWIAALRLLLSMTRRVREPGTDSAGGSAHDELVVDPTTVTAASSA
ncbi:MAG: COX15/CtaA family protein [Actinomycetes bacterium]